MKALVARSCPDSLQPQEPLPTRLPCPCNSSGRNTGVGCHFLLQDPGIKSRPPALQADSLPSETAEKPHKNLRGSEGLFASGQLTPRPPCLALHTLLRVTVRRAAAQHTAFTLQHSELPNCHGQCPPLTESKRP